MLPPLPAAGFTNDNLKIGREIISPADPDL